MSTHQARDNHQKYLPQVVQRPSLISLRSNEFVGYIPVGDRIFSTTVTEKTSVRAGLEKAVTEQGGRVLTYFDSRYNAHEIVGVWLPDGFTYSSGDQKKVAIALAQSGISPDSNIAIDLMNESERSEGRGSMHFYLGKDGIPFTRNAQGQLEFYNADEFRFSRCRNIISWSNTNSSFDPQVLSDFNSHYSNQGGANFTPTAVKEIELAHAGNRVATISLETPVLVITVSTGEISAASEYKTSLDSFEFQKISEFVAAVALTTALIPITTGSVTFSSGSVPVTTYILESSRLEPTPEIPIYRHERSNVVIPVSNDNAIRQPDYQVTQTVTSSPIELVRFIQRQLPSNDNFSTHMRRLPTAEVLPEITPSKAVEPLRTHPQETAFLVNSPLDPFPQKSISQRNPKTSVTKNQESPKSPRLRLVREEAVSDVVVKQKKVRTTRTEANKNLDVLAQIYISAIHKSKRSIKPPKKITHSNEPVNRQFERLSEKIQKKLTQRTTPKRATKQFSSFKLEPEKLLNSKPKVPKHNWPKSNLVAPAPTISQGKGPKKSRTHQKVVDLSVYRRESSLKPKTASNKLVLGNRPISETKLTPSALIKSRDKPKKKNKKKIPSALLRELIGLFPNKKNARKIINGIAMVGSLG